MQEEGNQNNRCLPEGLKDKPRKIERGVADEKLYTSIYL
jgi:hypothetical protein